MDAITTRELEREMTANGDAISYPYWATQEILWNGRRVIVQRPNPPSKDEE